MMMCLEVGLVSSCSETRRKKRDCHLSPAQASPLASRQIHVILFVAAEDGFDILMDPTADGLSNLPCGCRGGHKGSLLGIVILLLVRAHHRDGPALAVIRGPGELGGRSIPLLDDSAGL